MNNHRAAAGLSVLAAMAIGLGACGGGTTKAGTNAAAAGPLTPAPTTAVSAGAAAGAAVVVPAPTLPAATTAPTTPATTAKKAGTVAPTAPKATVAPVVPLVTVPPPAAPALAARRQPTPTEINSVISSVHALLPLFTPTAAQIAQSGDQVCTAFDQGKTAAQVKAAAMQLAGPYASLVPAATADSSLRTIVTLFCPGYLSKLA